MSDLKALAEAVRHEAHRNFARSPNAMFPGMITETIQALLAAVEAHECTDTRAGPVVENSRLRSQTERLRTTLAALIEVASPAIGVARLGETKTFMEDTKRLRALKTLADKAMSAFDNARAALVDPGGYQVPFPQTPEEMLNAGIAFMGEPVPQGVMRETAEHRAQRARHVLACAWHLGDSCTCGVVP